MCRYCDINSNECEIFIEPMSGDWYIDHCTGEWDEYNDDFVYDRIYISYCPWCGIKLGEE